MQPVVQVDAFTSQPFRGNPAAVCLLPAPRDPAWMQAVAREMNLSETAFLSPAQGDADYDLRWFTPTVEVDLCGHATLASAHVLFEDHLASPDSLVRFSTRSGLLTAALEGDWLELDFPAEPPIPCAAPPGLVEALDLEPLAVATSRENFLVEASSAAVVRALAPDFRQLRRLGLHGVIVTAAAVGDDECDFVSRYFAPGAGIDEDPVTGSAHCTLGPFWGARLKRDAMVGRQVSARQGIVRVRLRGDRVVLGGQAVTVMRGHLTVQPKART